MRPTHLIAILFVIVGCRLTDHSEKGEINTDVIHTPSSTGEDGKVPVLTPSVEVIDLGMITQGEVFEYDLEIENTGEGPLVLTDVRASCGCTVSKDWPREPIAPNEKATIKVSFNSEGKSGLNESTISIVGNTRPATTAVLLKAEVIAPELFKE